eukprot:TRINITY_DN13564_c0_g1_i1.p1 TRINITY_DN13564_c0_g1~~TRINITY_DN13564_c0_g1_i1.p1  ORF type:complete len:108 (+),score=31.47 TRINITY_DN13564_c0_g1_i1:155-478(+)
MGSSLSARYGAVDATVLPAPEQAARDSLSKMQHGLDSMIGLSEDSADGPSAQAKEKMGLVRSQCEPFYELFNECMESKRHPAVGPCLVLYTQFYDCSKQALQTPDEA